MSAGRLSIRPPNERHIMAKKRTMQINPQITLTSTDEKYSEPWMDDEGRLHLWLEKEEDEPFRLPWPSMMYAALIKACNTASLLILILWVVIKCFGSTS